MGKEARHGLIDASSRSYCIWVSLGYSFSILWLAIFQLFLSQVWGQKYLSAGPDLTTAHSQPASRWDAAGTEATISRLKGQFSFCQVGPISENWPLLTKLAGGLCRDDGESVSGLWALIPATSSVT